ncbi:hypothetical protein MAR_009105 [Mya arenaria]|uniref:Uncharacterized protein n=1 Tax=Mya arenaria TaxID=6604 RepID=A0ABY7E143_MYAAR|nr:hypothetical protein MAR_009105 [Mya arenaria]
MSVNSGNDIMLDYHKRGLHQRDISMFKNRMLMYLDSGTNSCWTMASLEEASKTGIPYMLTACAGNR